jgi:glycerophosphoryl diester phosphodiesterase
MPTLDEVLRAFPGKHLLINVKSNDAREGARLAARLLRLRPDARERLMVYGGEKPMAVIRARLPDIRTMSPRGGRSLMTCLLRYAALGWSGYVPEACRRSLIVVPMNIGPWLWGWPDRFAARMEGKGSLVFVAGPYRDGDATGGIDSQADFEALPPGHIAGIWTDEIAQIAPLAHKKP